MIEMALGAAGFAVAMATAVGQKAARRSAVFRGADAPQCRLTAHLAKSNTRSPTNAVKGVINMKIKTKILLVVAGLMAIGLFGMIGDSSPSGRGQSPTGSLFPSGSLVSSSYGYLRYRLIDNRSAVEIVSFRGGITAPLPSEVGPVQIPSHIGGLPVIRIRERVFTRPASGTSSVRLAGYEGMGVTHACLPYTLTDIGDRSFYRNRLTNVDIPSGVTHIRRHAFERNNIRSVYIPHGVEHIGVRAFQNNNIGSITIPDSVQYIGALAFRQNQITAVSVPHHTVIADNSFDRDVMVTRR